MRLGQVSRSRYGINITGFAWRYVQSDCFAFKGGADVQGVGSMRSDLSRLILVHPPDARTGLTNGASHR